MFAHLPEEADDARAIATELDVEARRRAFRSLNAPVPVGARLQFELLIPGLEIDDPVASLIWQGTIRGGPVRRRIPSAAPVGTVIGTVSISRDGVPLGHVKFKLGSRPPPARRPASGSRGASLPVRLVSCALCVAGPRRGAAAGDAADHRARVLPGRARARARCRSGRAGSSEPSGTLTFSCSSGRAVRRNRAVRREVDFAIACKAGDDFSPPEIRPVIIEGPPVVPPWKISRCTSTIACSTS